MRIKIFLLLGCFLATSLLIAKTTNPVATTSSKLSINELGCDLPAPTNFTVVEVGPSLDWVHLHWNLSSPLYAHRINIYNVTKILGQGFDTVLVNSVIVPAGVEDTTLLCAPNHPCGNLYEIKAICTSKDSPNSAWAIAPGPPVGYILDLIIVGFTPTGSAPTCTMNQVQGGERCYFSNSGTATFRVRQTTNYANKRVFGIEKNHTTSRLTLKVDGPNNEGNSSFYNFYASYVGPNAYGKEEYEIKQNNQVIAKFIGDFASESESYLESRFIMPGYEIIRTSPHNGSNKPSDFSDEPLEGREALSNIIVSQATAFPNPFIESLEVYLSAPSSEQVNLALYNLNGQKVLDQQFVGGQEQYSLSTAMLSPGFYFLRIEASGEIQTLKVIKSE